MDRSEVLERSGAGHFVEQEPQVVAFSTGTDSIDSTNGMILPDVINLILSIYQLPSLASLPLLGTLIPGVVLGQLGVFNGLCKVVFGAEFKEGCEGSCWGWTLCSLPGVGFSEHHPLAVLQMHCQANHRREVLVSGVLEDAQGCFAAAHIPSILELGDLVHCPELVWLFLVVFLLCALQFEHRLVRSLRNVFEFILDTFDAAADHVDVTVELEQQEGIIWHYLLVGDLLLYLLAIMTHIHSPCAAAVILACGGCILGSYRFLALCIGGIAWGTLGALTVDYAGRVHV